MFIGIVSSMFVGISCNSVIVCFSWYCRAFVSETLFQLVEFVILNEKQDNECNAQGNIRIADISRTRALCDGKYDSLSGVQQDPRPLNDIQQPFTALAAQE